MSLEKKIKINNTKYKLTYKSNPANEIIRLIDAISASMEESIEKNTGFDLKLDLGLGLNFDLGKKVTFFRDVPLSEEQLAIRQKLLMKILDYLLSVKSFHLFLYPLERAVTESTQTHFHSTLEATRTYVQRSASVPATQELLNETVSAIVDPNQTDAKRPISFYLIKTASELYLTRTALAKICTRLISFIDDAIAESTTLHCNQYFHDETPVFKFNAPCPGLTMRMKLGTFRNLLNTGEAGPNTHKLLCNIRKGIMDYQQKLLTDHNNAENYNWPFSSITSNKEATHSNEMQEVEDILSTLTDPHNPIKLI